MVDDSPIEAEKIQLQIQSHGFHVDSERVDTDQGMQAALQQQDWDLILANFVTKNLNGMRALDLAKQKKTPIPFIMLANRLEEEAVVQAVKAGADNFVVNHNFPRLLELVGQINTNGKKNKKLLSQPPLEGCF